MVLIINQIILFILISKTKTILPECPKIVCGQLKREGEKCFFYDPKNKSNIIDISLCLGDNKFCPIQSDTFEEGSLYCEEKPKKSDLMYPGIECENDMECLTKKCINYKCYGKGKNEKCENDIECIQGLTCMNNRCEELRQPGEFCYRDSNCIMSAGCHRSKCTEYFSLSDGEYVEQEQYFNDGLSFCKGGTTINNTCITLNLINPKEPCDNETNPCKYSINKTLTNNITLYENCLCGYNFDGLRYCKLGGGDLNYTRFRNYKMNYLKNEGDMYCHTIEHGINNVCHYNEEDESFLVYLNYELWALYNYQLYNTPDCVIKNIFPDYNKELDTKEVSDERCGQFSCEKTDNETHKCIIKKYENYDINVTLLYNNTVNSPNKKYKCPVNKENLYQLDSVNIDYEIEENYEQYDGDYCEKECINYKYNISFKCENHTCILIKDDDFCDDHYRCSAGEYCIEGKCKKQLTIGQKCFDDYQCENHLICFNYTCQDELLKKEIGEVSAQSIACYYNLSNNGICIKKERKNKNNNKLYDDFIECNNTDDCTYYKIKNITLGINNTEIGKDFCECGYRKNTIKYCPLINDDFPDLWDKYVQLYRFLSKNKCHTLKRYSCNRWKVEKKSLYDEYISLKIFFEKGHYFYKSDDCVEYLLIGNYLYLNKVILILLYLFIII